MGWGRDVVPEMEGGRGGTNNTCDPMCVRHVSIPPKMDVVGERERKIRGRIGQVVYEKQKEKVKR